MKKPIESGPKATTLRYPSKFVSRCWIRNRILHLPGPDPSGFDPEIIQKLPKSGHKPTLLELKLN